MPSDDDLRRRALSLIDRTECGLLVTLDGDGHPHARWMHVMSAGGLHRLITLSSEATRKVREIADNPLVTWVFTDANFGDVLLLKGRARIHHDFGEIQQAWDRLAGAAQRYAVGPLADSTDNRLVTIDTRVAHLEMTSPALGIQTAREVMI